MRIGLAIVLALGMAGQGAAYEVVAVVDGGTLAGTVRYAGTPPAPERVAVTKDVEVCGQEKVRPGLRVGRGGGIQDVAVVVRASRGKPLEVSADPVVFDQRGCEYRPYVLAFPAGSTVRVLNPDGVLHNVHVMGKANPASNRAMPRFQKQIDWKVEKPEWPIAVQCNAHPWMRAYWLSMDQPYYAVTGADGRFSIADLLPGGYEVEIWHPTLGRRVEQVTIRPEETTTVEWSMTKE